VGYDEEYDLLYVSSSDNKLTLFSTEGRKGCKNYLQAFTSNNNRCFLQVQIRAVLEYICGL
jgi:hypothetical protein